MSEKLGRNNPDIPLGEETGEAILPVEIKHRENISKKEAKNIGNLARKLQQKTAKAVRGRDYESLSEVERAERDTKAAMISGAVAGGLMGGGALIEGAGLSGVIGGAVIGGALAGKEFAKKEAEVKKWAYESAKREQEINWKKLIEEVENDR